MIQYPQIIPKTPGELEQFYLKLIEQLGDSSLSTSDIETSMQMQTNGGNALDSIERTLADLEIKLETTSNNSEDLRELARLLTDLQIRIELLPNDNSAIISDILTKISDINLGASNNEIIMWMGVA